MVSVSLLLAGITILSQEELGALQSGAHLGAAVGAMFLPSASEFLSTVRACWFSRGAIDCCYCRYRPPSRLASLP